MHLKAIVKSIYKSTFDFDFSVEKPCHLIMHKTPTKVCKTVGNRLMHLFIRLLYKQADVKFQLNLLALMFGCLNRQSFEHFWTKNHNQTKI